MMISSKKLADIVDATTISQRIGYAFLSETLGGDTMYV